MREGWHANEHACVCKSLLVDVDVVVVSWRWWRVEEVESGGVVEGRETGCFFRGLQLIMLNTLTHRVVRSVANAEQRATMT